MRIDAQWAAVMAALISLYGCGGSGNDNHNNEPPPPSTFTVGGTVSGLAGSGLALTLNGNTDLTVDAAGNFAFPTGLTTGSSYAVTVKTQPASPTQTCVVTSASGSVASSAISNIAVSCSTNTYSVGGAVSGLAGSGLVLTVNGQADLAVGIAGNFMFAEPLASGSNYAVAVKTQPALPSQTCVVTNGSGIVGDGPIANVSVGCTINSYSVNAAVSGLTGSGLLLRLNGASLPVASDGSVAFPSALPSGSNYSVTIGRQPTSPQQTCVATDSFGVVSDSAVTVPVTCNTDTYSVSGTVSGLTGSDLVLQLNGTQDLPVTGDGRFVFPGSVLSGTQYAVTVRTQTSTYRELCAVTRATGIGTTVDITDVNVACGVVEGFVYVADDNQILRYGILPDSGALLPMGPAATTGADTRDMVVAPNGTTLYVADAVTNTVYSYSIDQDKGRLSPLGAPLATGPGAYAAQLAIAPSGNFLYVGHLSGGAVTMFAIDPVTGALTAQGVAATVAASLWLRDISITPDGAFLYLLDRINTGESNNLTVYAVDATTGALTAGTTLPADGMEGMTLDPLGRFLYLRESVSQIPASDTTNLYPYTIDPATGELTPVNINTTGVLSNAASMIVEPSGRYAYLLGNFNARPADNHVDAFSIDQSTGALTSIGTPVLVPGGVYGGMAIDASGRFLFVGNEKFSGTFDPGVLPYDASTFAIHGTGPTEGQLSAAGSAGSLSATRGSIVVAQ
jgi:6-phosphogluconolactonase (cycloisomerase 2 family)